MGVGRMGDLNELVERLQSRKGEAITRTEKLMDEAAAALTSLIAERDGAADTSMRIALKYADAAERVSSLYTRAIAAETKLKAATEALTSLLIWTKFELGPELASKQPWALVIANSEAALSLDSNKGDGV